MKISEIVEQQLIQSLMNQEFLPGEAFPTERQLAKQFDVGRSTIREAIQRLEQQGWITCRRGHAPLVNDIWKTGNMSTLVHMMNTMEEADEQLVVHLLELRKVIAPTYTTDAILNFPHQVIEILNDRSATTFSTATSCAQYDWYFQKQLAILHPNPLYLLLLNSFDTFYIPMASRYFEYEKHRTYTSNYYQLLSQTLHAQNIQQACLLTQQAMETSIQLWKQILKEEPI